MCSSLHSLSHVSFRAGHERDEFDVVERFSQFMVNFPKRMEFSNVNIVLVNFIGQQHEIVFVREFDDVLHILLR